VERAARILEALGAEVRSHVELSEGNLIVAVR